MGGLKPIGSEKLEGQDKINRIMEIATYGTVQKNKEYHTSTNSFSKTGADGRTYAIVQERDGYYLKSGINESSLDYLNGLQNKRKDRFKSYGAALKRMNLIFKPLNEEHNDGKAITMYEQYEVVDVSMGEMEEQEKFVLNVDDGGEEEMDMGDDMDLDMGDEEMDMEDDMEDEMDVDMEDEELEVEDEVEDEMEGFMKPIQKLTGKLGQKLRDAEEELGSADIKYVLNSVISAVDLDNLDDEDRDDVLDRFEEDETSYGDEEEMDMDMGDEEMDVDMDMGDEEMDVDMDVDMETEDDLAMESLKKRVGSLLESYIEKKSEKPKNKKVDPKEYLTKKLTENKKLKDITKISSSVEQEVSSHKFIKENKNFRLEGKTKRNSLVFVSENKKVLINTKGIIK
tara:strand:+ start:2814 stop:4007 length:1194 start_codon:yes stop_codon:yes gene_type:complete